MRHLIVTVALMFGAQTAQAQCCSLHDWWSGQSTFLDQHPVAHVMGGAGLDLVARGPWITKSWRDTPAKRIAWVAVEQGLWEWIQWENWKQPNGVHSYPARYGLWDLGTAVLSASALEVVLARFHHRRM